MMSATTVPPLQHHAARHGLDAERFEAALEWQVALWSGETDDQDRQCWAVWLAAHPDNLKAWEEVERLAGRLQTVPAEVGRRSLQRPAMVTRRHALTLFALAGAGWIASQNSWVQRRVADCHSAKGEQRDVDLVDGSRLKLNTDSGVNIQFASERRLTVQPGSEIALDSRRGRGGPFFVEMSGMTFDVAASHLLMRDHGDRLQVSVLAGQVDVVSGLSATVAAPLLAGQEVWLSATALQRLPLNRSAAMAWTRGVLQADRMPMGLFLAELGRYRRGLLYCDEDIADLIVSGAYALNDTDFILQSVVEALPVEVHYRTPWLVHVRASKKNQPMA